MPVGGTWYNELGSKMVLSVEGSQVTGTYHTTVGAAQGAYQLIGSVDVTPSDGGQAVAWGSCGTTRA